MSKAFMQEAESALSMEVDGPDPALPTGVKNYMTRRGHAALMAAYEHLLDVERPQVVQTVAWAASNGDRSENGDYLYGKRRLREMDRRIRYLGRQLTHAVVVNPTEQTRRGRVYFGAQVRVRDTHGVEKEYQIVGVDEVEAAAGRISWLSPLARSLHLAGVGDTVQCRGPAGVSEMEVLAIRYDDL
jgi:transcription elongation factor GreB